MDDFRSLSDYFLIQTYENIQRNNFIKACAVLYKWQGNGYSGILVWLAVGRYGAAMVFCNFFTQGQPDAPAFGKVHPLK